jgi:septum formation protein
LLHQAGLAFSVELCPVEELMPAAHELKAGVMSNARAKAQAVFHRQETHVKPKKNGLVPEVVLAADTLVALEERVLGKPKDLAEARTFLNLLANRPHRVLTGVTVLSNAGPKEQTFCVETLVTLKALTTSEMDALFQRSTPLDKAAGYGFQDAPEIVQAFSGSQTNVFGLPMEATLEALQPFYSRPLFWPPAPSSLR